jgi:hypothetical protein
MIGGKEKKEKMWGEGISGGFSIVVSYFISITSLTCCHLMIWLFQPYPPIKLK